MFIIQDVMEQIFRNIQFIHLWPNKTLFTENHTLFYKLCPQVQKYEQFR